MRQRPCLIGTSTCPDVDPAKNYSDRRGAHRPDDHYSGLDRRAGAAGRRAHRGIDVLHARLQRPRTREHTLARTRYFNPLDHHRQAAIPVGSDQKVAFCNQFDALGG